MNASPPWYLRVRLRTRQLMLLVALDDEGNIHRAAEALNISRPAASKMLKELEDMLEVSLFDRLPRGMQATWYGEVMVRHARTVLSHFVEAHEELEALRAGRAGNVSVGVVLSPALSLVPAALDTVARERPGLRVQIQVEASDVLLDRLAQGKLDILVARLFDGHDNTHLRYEPLDDEPVSAFVRRGHALLGRERLGLRDVAAASWIVPTPGKMLRHRFEVMFREAGLATPSELIEMQEPLLITRILQTSDFIAVFPTNVGRYCCEHGMIDMLPLELPCRMDTFGLITRTDRALSPSARVMLKALRHSASTHYQIDKRRAAA